MKNKFLIGAFVSAFLLIAPNVKAANFTDNQIVNANKTWTIKFTDVFGFDDGKIQGINVTDSTNNTVNIGIDLGEDGKTMTIRPPQGGYIPGESYTLNIGNKVHSNKGKILKHGYMMHFTIKSSDDVVTFNDRNLEQAIRYEINKLTGDIYKSDVEKITELHPSGDIKDISGIENLTNLQDLNLGLNRISDISALKGLSNLKQLSLWNNEISDISALKGLTNLEKLDLGYNQISDADIQALKSILPNCKIEYTTIKQINSRTAIVVPQNESYTLPETFTAVMSDGYIKNVSVKWNNQVVDTSKVGTVTYTGKVNGYSDNVNLTITVKDIKNINNDFNINYSFSSGTVSPEYAYNGSIKIDSNLNCELNYYTYKDGKKTLNKKFNISEEQKNTLYKLMVDNQFSTKEWRGLENYRIPVGSGPSSLSGILNENKFDIPGYLYNDDSKIVSPVYKFIDDLVKANLSNE